MLAAAITELARDSPSWHDQLRRLDSTPVPCAASRETVKRSELAGYAGYGYCASHSRYFWGVRLYLAAAPDGIPIIWGLAKRTNPADSARSAGPGSGSKRSSTPSRANSTLEEHGARTPVGLYARVAARLLALTELPRLRWRLGSTGSCCLCR